MAERKKRKIRSNPGGAAASFDAGRGTCNHEQCRRVRTLMMGYIFEPDAPFTQPQKKMAAQYIEAFLCDSGKDREVAVPKDIFKLLTVSFTRACLKANVTGLVGQEQPWYPECARLVEEANARMRGEK